MRHIILEKPNIKYDTPLYQSPLTLDMIHLSTPTPHHSLDL